MLAAATKDTPHPPHKCESSLRDEPPDSLANRLNRASARAGRGDEPPNTLGNRLNRAGADSGESFGAGERALAFPFVVFAQFGLVLFHLGFEFAEGFLATGPHGGPGAGGVQRSGWQR
jgi:hypothetical protein